MKKLEQLSFKQQLLLFFSTGILIMVALISSLEYSISKKTMDAKQREQGLKIAQTLASQSELSLLFDSKENAENAVKSILEFPDVVAVEIFRSDLTALLFSGQTEFQIDDPVTGLPMPVLAKQNDLSWYFEAPVFHLPTMPTPFADNNQARQILGYVRVSISKKSLNQATADHLFYNIVASFILALLFVMGLMWVSTRMTDPIKNLVKVMKKVKAGERDLRADVTGPSDIQHILSTFNNMIGAREAEEIKIKLALDMALDAAKMKGDFATNVSHELRTPMNGIIGMLDVLRDSGNLSQKQNEYLDVIYSSSNSLLELINDILDFTRINEGKMEVEADDFYLIDVVHNVVDLLSGQAQRKDLEIGLEIDPDIPDLVNGDSNRVRQILINLLGNAIKFTDEGDILVRLELIQEADETVTYKISVEDTGAGINNDSLDKIFEPFTQLDSAPSRIHGGSGLGLTICHQLIDLLGGEMGVSSIDGIGSTFWFSIPFKVAKKEPQFNIDKHRPEVAGLRVLVVDDSVVNRHAITSILKKWDTYQQTAPTAQSALIKLKQAANKTKAFDFIIIDHQMKTMAYDDLIAQIQASPELSQTRIIMTINSAKLGKTDALQKGVGGIIEKPVRDIKLYQCITSIMNASIEPEFHELIQQELLPTKRKVLVVEDTRTNQVVSEEILYLLGCEVDVANNGQDAVDNYFSNHYDLIFMDCRMPFMDGYQATKVFRENEKQGRHTPIVAMTANTQKDVEVLCNDAGMDDYLAKPLTIESVREMLFKWANELNFSDEKTDEHIDAKNLDIDQYADSNFLRSEFINDTNYQHLLKSVGVKAIIKMAETLCEDMPDKLEDLSNAVAQHNRRMIVDLAHSLKSCSQNFGAEEFSTLAREIEVNGRTMNFDDLANKISRLCDIGHNFRKELIQVSDREKRRIQSEIRYRVLVVEDNRTDQIALVNNLRNNNLLVDLATSGSQAIDKCQQCLPDLILLDVHMPEKDFPDMDGFVACRKIKEIPGAQHVPVLMVTALDDELSINKAIQSGASDYVTKPVNFNVLQLRLKQLLISSHGERQLKKVAYTDALTGLPNRAYYIDQLATQIKKDANEKLSAIIFMGLDQFKLINEGIGHDIGDALLQSVAKRLKTMTNDNVFIARTSGDEFSFILTEMNSVIEVEDFVKSIRFEIEHPFYILRETINISASIGVSVFPIHGKDLSLLLKRADTAMYYAKKNTQGYLFFDIHMAEKATRRLKVLSGLHNAIHNDELLLCYQPQYTVQGKSFSSCEVLVRWNSPKFGMVLPNDFIPYAEESGLIIELGEWVILNACMQLKIWRKYGFKHLKIAINLSGRQLEQKDLPDKVAEILNQTGVLAENIEFEITESALMKNLEQCVNTLQQLREMGFDIAIDDFGTGYNTLSHLEKYPITTIKIDKSFTQNIQQNVGPSIIQGIISFSKGLNYKVVAEGVENEEHMDYLVNMGCDILQGYLLGKPVSAAMFEQSILRKMKKSGRQMELSVTPITKYQVKK